MTSRAHSMALHPSGPLTDAGLEARRKALEDEELGLAGTFLVEPLTALAGGIIGGAIVTALVWRAAWQMKQTTAALTGARTAARLLRRYASL